MLSTSDDLPATVKWLLAQYELIEHAAREAGEDDVPGWQFRDGLVVGTDARYDSQIIGRSAEPTSCQRQHIALHDPMTVLADITAKREIIAGLMADNSVAGQRRAAHVIQRLATALAHR
jgi:Family of unknown function (DUF6221)